MSEKRETNYMYEKIAEHVGHNIEIVFYGRNKEAVAIECTDCDAVIYDVEKYDI